MLQEAGKSREEINKKIADLTGKSEREVKNIFEDSSYKSYKADMGVYKKAGIEALSFAQSPAMLSVLRGLCEQTNGTLYNITQTTANAAQQLLINEMSAAQMRIMSGQQSYNQAIRQTINKISSEGLKVNYKGMERNLESVVRTAVLTGVNQAGIKSTLYNTQQMGSDLVLTTAHLGARIGEGYKGHINWQGRVCSISGIPHPEEELRIGQKILSLYDDTGYSKVDGLGGANCRHSVQSWHEGHSTNPYFDKQGNPLYDTEQSNELYRKQQEQRGKERAIRNTKRKLQTLSEAISQCKNPELKEDLQKDYDRTAMRLRQKQVDYKQFSEENNLPTQNERMHIANWGKAEAAEAYSTAIREQKAFSLKAKYDIISKEVKEIGIRGNIILEPVDIDLKDYTFDDKHINFERDHNISRENAESYIKTSKIIITRNNGRFFNFYSSEGAAYVDLEEKNIRTAFAKEQFDEKIIKMMEVLEKYGK